MNLSEISFDQFIYGLLIVVVLVLVLSIVGYYFTKCIMLGFYEAKLFFKKKLKESNDEKR